MKALRIGIFTSLLAVVPVAALAQTDFYAGNGTLASTDDWNSSASGLKWATAADPATWTAAASGNSYHLNGYVIRAGRTATLNNTFAGETLYIDAFASASNQAATSAAPVLTLELASPAVGPRTSAPTATWGTYTAAIVVPPAPRPFVPGISAATGTMPAIQGNTGVTTLAGSLVVNGDMQLKLPSTNDVLFDITSSVTGTGRIEAAGGSAGGSFVNGWVTWQFEAISGDNTTMGSGWQGASISVLNKHTMGFGADTNFYRTNPNGALIIAVGSPGFLNLANGSSLSLGSGKFVIATFPTPTVLPDGVYTVSLLNKLITGLAAEGTYVTGTTSPFTGTTPNTTGTTSKVYVGSPIGSSNPSAVPAVANNPNVAVPLATAMGSLQVVATNSPTSFSASNLPDGLSIDPATGVISGTATTAGTTTATVMATNAYGTGRANLTFNVGVPMLTVQTGFIIAAGTAVGNVSVAGSNLTSSTTWTAPGLPAGVSLTAATGSSTKLTGTPTTPGTYPVTVTATNANGSGSTTITFHITGAGVAPEVLDAASIAGKVGSPLYYQIEATNTPTSYDASPLPPGMTIDASTGLISGSPTDPGVTTTTLTATNATGSGSATLTIAVGTPAITSSTDPATALNGQPFSYQIAASNGATSFTAYPLPAGLSIDPSTGLISGTPTANGTTTVTLGASNAASTGTATFSLIVRDAGPGITSAATASGTVGTAFDYQVTTARAATSFSATGLPDGLTIDPTTGAIGGTPTAAATSTAEISATNAEGTSTQTVAITIDEATPVIASESKTAIATETFSYQISATGHPASYTASPLPDGLTIDTATGVISGIPTSVSSTTVNVTATNSTGTGSGTLTINVVDPVPAVTSSAVASGAVGVAFTYQIAATGHPTSFAASPLPAGLSLDASTGVISGMPTAAASTTVDVSAINATGTGTASLVITINHEVPLITSAGTASGKVGESFTYQIVATGLPTNYGAVPLPAGLSLDPTTGVISGVPTSAGATTVAITATNETGAGDGSVLVTIQDAVPTITSPTSAYGSVGAAFNYQITASGSPTSFDASPLPAGLSVDPATGVISGTPATAAVSTVTLSATNANGTGTATLTLTIGSVLATQSVVGPGYAPGQVVTITNTFAYAGTASDLHWNAVLPAGWTYAGSGGSAGDTQPVAGQSGSLEWTWASPPASPVTFTYSVNVPTDATGAQSLAASVTLSLDATPATVTAVPGPLVLNRVQFHSADTNHDGAIDVLELSRVIELYNTHNGTTRTGAYAVAAGSEDGFTPDSTRPGGEPVTLTAYHSADENHDGQISLAELTRVIALYNTHTGSTRTGAYHPQTGTEDGFATGQ